MRAIVGLAAVLLAAALGAVVLGLGPADPTLPGQVAARLHDSGVDHPVTAVLLAFRAYDTLLEVAVLAAALMPVLAGAPDPRDPDPDCAPREAVLGPFTGLLTPLAILVAVHLLWVGSHAPGGAFQAAAVMAAALVLLRLSGRLPAVGLERPWVRALLGLGLAGFVALAAVTAALGQGLLVLPSAQAGALILAIEVALAVSIAATLGALFPRAVVAGSEGPAAPPGAGR